MTCPLSNATLYSYHENTGSRGKMEFGEVNQGMHSVGGQDFPFLWTANSYAGGWYVWIVFTDATGEGFVKIWGMQFGSSGQYGHGMEAQGTAHETGFTPSVIEITPTPRT
ncbi:MAG: hypothetical protein AAGJ96_07900 [Pseudomonadota bacterium]